MGLVLDSSVLITAERRGDAVAQLLRQVVAATGGSRSGPLIHRSHRAGAWHLSRARIPQVRSRRESFIFELISCVEVYPYTKETALLAGRLEGEQQEQGVTIPFSDLLIGATALLHGCSMLTVNPRHFRLIPGLSVV